MRKVRLVLAGVVLTAVGALSGCVAAAAAAAAHRADPTPSSSGHVTVAMSFGPIQGPPPYGPSIPANSFRIVGGDFAPGIYRASVPAGSGCTWTIYSTYQTPRLSDVAAGGTTAQVAINVTDWGFESLGCGPWRTI